MAKEKGLTVEEQNILIEKCAGLLKESQEKLKEAKKEEMAMRMALFSAVVGKKKFTEAEKIEHETKNYTIKIAVSESLEIHDKDALLDYAINLHEGRDDLDDEDQIAAEKWALSLKPDITITRAKTLEEEYPDSEIFDSLSFKVSPTPTITIEGKES